MLSFIIIGALAGFFAGKIIKGEGYGLFVNMFIGIIGAIVGGWVFGFLGFQAAYFIGELITATVGALLVLFIAGKHKANRKHHHHDGTPPSANS